MKALRLCSISALLGTACAIGWWGVSAANERRADKRTQLQRSFLTQGKTASSERATVHAAKRGAPRLTLQDGYELAAQIIDGFGNAVTPAAMGTPLATASADFDSDGVADLICSYAGGRLALYRGNVDSIYPHGSRARQRKATGEFMAAPFLPQAQLFNTPESPDTIFAGDFNADGHRDVLAGTYDSKAIYLLAGNGRGTFGEAKKIDIAGRLAAIATGEIGRQDGQTDIAVGVVTEKGPELLVYEHPEGAFKRRPEVFNLPAPPTAIALGQLDEDGLFDIAVACGQQLVFVHGHQQIYPWDLLSESKLTRPPATVGLRAFSFRIAAIVTGKFANNRGDSVVMLADDGSLHLLEPAPTGQTKRRKYDLAAADAYRSANVPAGNFQKYERLRSDVQLSPEEAARRGVKLIERKPGQKTSQAEVDDLFVAPQRARKEKPLRKQPSLASSFYTAPSRIREWRESVWFSDYRLAAVAQSRKKHVLTGTRVSSSSFDDLIVVDEHAQQVHVVAAQGTEVPEVGSKQSAVSDPKRGVLASLDVAGGPAAVHSMRLNADALSDFVIFRNGSSAPSIVTTGAANTYVVNTNGDGSSTCATAEPCTLRGAIQAANSNPGADFIFFDIPGGGIQTIAPLSPLPIITSAVTIDATTQPGYIDSPVIEITGSGLSEAADGLKVRASDCTIRGLAINEFPHFEDPNTGSFIGGNGLSLETLLNQTRHSNNFVEGNFLGTDATGTLDKGNASTGLIMFDVDNNMIGGLTPEARNVMSGNGTLEERGAGISVVNGIGNQFKGNYIGIDASGTEKLGNTLVGLDLTGSNNTVGGDEEGAGNTISGNGEIESDPPTFPCGNGLGISVLTEADGDTNLTLNNSVRGNRIGTDPSGTQPLGNCFFGISAAPITQTVIGSITEEGRNVISDNGHYAVNCTYILSGVVLPGGFCIISGNNIGTDITGTIGIRNDGRNTPFPLFPVFGVVTASAEPDALVSVGAPGGTTPGGPCTGFCNLISGNDAGDSFQGEAVQVGGVGLNGVFNSYIGTDRNGTSALPNELGVFMRGNSYLGNVGCVFCPPEDVRPLGNLISGNNCGATSVSAGISNAPDSSFTAYVRNNFIGTDVTGNNPLPNNPTQQCGNGALNASGNSFSTIYVGGTEKALQRNIISANGGDGLWLQGNAVATNNYIGVGQNGTTSLGNGGHGITVKAIGGDRPNIVGGTGANEANIIRNNAGAGVYLDKLFFPFPQHSVITDIRANSIFNNGGLGIDIFPLGVNANDAGDADVGPNDLQNYPLLDEPTFNGNGTVTVTGRLNSFSGQAYRIDFYANDPADPTNYGEGQTYLGSKSVTTNAGGNTTFSFTSSGPVPVNSAIVATATNGGGNTSEFSCVAGECVADVSLIKSDDVDPIEAGQTLTYTLSVTNAGPAAAPDVVVTDNLPPANVTFISATTSQGSCVRSGNTVTCNLGTINKNATVTIEIKVTPTQVGTLTNHASVTHDLSDPDPSNNVDDETTEVVNSLIIVTTTGDESDSDPNDSICDVDPNEPENQCTLRAAIQVANARTGKDAITFDIPGGGIKTITPQSALPAVNQAATIDATTQPGYSGTPVVELNGSAAGGGFPGLLLNGGNTTIKGFAINRFDGNGIWIQNSNGNTVEACFIGTDPSGATAQGNHAHGIFLDNASNNQIGGASSDKRNIISGNGTAGNNDSGGVYIFGSAGNSQNNVVQGNYIGTNASGAAPLPNVNFGILLAASNNTIGGSGFLPGSAPGNVIAGNDTSQGFGIGLNGISGHPATNNVISGNLIGTNAAGGAALGYKIGVFILGDADNNLIGGSSTGSRNIISGNLSGVGINGPDATGNRVEGNYIGTDISGNAALANQVVGVDIQGSPNNAVGGATQGTGNVIAGNTLGNVSITFIEATGNTVQGNYVGVFADGSTTPATRATYGISIQGGAQSTVVGGITASQRNVVAANKYGVIVVGASNVQLGNNTIQGNYIGTDSTGRNPLGNEVGVGLFMTFNNLIGGAQSGARNIISGNSPAAGVLIANGGGDNQVQGNYIGTDLTGARDVGNAAGVAIFQSSDNTIGTENLISGNEPLGGVIIANEGAPPPPTFTEPRLHKGIPIHQSGSPQESFSAHIVTYAAAIDPLASGSSKPAPISPAAASGNLVSGNRIGLSANSRQAIANKPAGVIITLGAAQNTIQDNFLSGNQDSGIFIGNTQENQPPPSGNLISGNFVGVGVNPATTPTPVLVPNSKYGIFLLEGHDNTFMMNIVVGNGLDGAGIQGGSTGNVFEQNFFGVTPQGKAAANGRDGIRIEDSPGNTIGGENAGEGNSIGGNAGNGITVTTTGQSPKPEKNGVVPRASEPPTVIVGNLIGGAFDQSAGTVAKAGNAVSGIVVQNASNVVIGSAAPNGGNSVIANGGAGIAIAGAGSTVVKVVNNAVGAVKTSAGSVSEVIGNAGDGIRVMDGAQSNTIERNTIVGNSGNGIMAQGITFLTVTGNVIGVIQQQGGTVKRENLEAALKILDAADVQVRAMTDELGDVIENVFSGNAGPGVVIEGPGSFNNLIRNTLIGTDENGTAGLGNGGDGVLIRDGAKLNTIGGPEANSGNTIANNGGAGVALDASAGHCNMIDPNTIYGNAGLGIDLGNDGITPNDFHDPDVGPNQWQNFPEFSSAVLGGDGGLVVQYVVDSAPENSDYGTQGLYIEFFKADSSLEGQTFIGSTHYTVANYNDGTPGVATVTLPDAANLGVAVGDKIVATTTDADGNTSEFTSVNVGVVDPGGPISSGSIIVSEFRLRGAAGTADEFIEFYNNTNTNITVSTVDGSAGWALVAADGAVRFVILNGAVIPARGHYLAVNSAGYSLTNYGGTGAAAGDISYTTEIPDGSGVALFSTANAANFTLANQVDAVGFTGVGALYREGAGLTSPGANNGEYSFVRKMALTGLPRDTDDNAADFAFVSTDGGVYGGVQSILGAPGPEITTSPIQRNATIKGAIIDPGCAGNGAATTACARVRDTTPDAPNNSALGTLSLRRKFTNNTGQMVTRLRFRVVDITTAPQSPGNGTADLRLRTSATIVGATLSGGGTTTIQGLTLEEGPNQPSGGGLNSTVSAGTITLAAPLAAGASINVNFLLGVQQSGAYRIYVNVEALP